jgi:hypothetical protein
MVTRLLGLRVSTPAIIFMTSFMLGCRPEQTITTATQPIEKEPPAKEEKRFLAAVLPTGDGYFLTLRLFADKSAVDAAEVGFYQFLKSLEMPPTSNDAPKWTLPEGWVETQPSAAAAGFRWVTMKNKAGIEMYLSKPASGSMLENVNRWRTGFVGIPAIADKDLPLQLKPYELGTTKASIIDMTGPGGTGAMTPPFAK